jgi:hypothetical protein
LSTFPGGLSTLELGRVYACSSSSSSCFSVQPPAVGVVFSAHPLNAHVVGNSSRNAKHDKGKYNHLGYRSVRCDFGSPRPHLVWMASASCCAYWAKTTQRSPPFSGLMTEPSLTRGSAGSQATISEQPMSVFRPNSVWMTLINLSFQIWCTGKDLNLRIPAGKLGYSQSVLATHAPVQINPKNKTDRLVAARERGL